MDEKKHAIIGKGLIENRTITKLTDLTKYIPKKTIAQGMGIHWNTLSIRMENLGSLTLDNLLSLAESLEVDPMTIVTLAASQCIQERKKKARK
ncbi:MAG: hypothetical protein ABI675_02840 [Chitinophagaceae bacterium]